MRSPESTTRHPRTAGRRDGRAFTLPEILVSVLIIGILMAIILVAVNHAGALVGQKADRASVSAIAQGVRQFDQTFGFPPPLVQDGLQG
ncbi:MAG: type II secretion system GspH family protein, partial [Phycisphaerales bacterium]|nr:type II secretion system GspH family protein [Phycisphaerales bacterium]